MNSLSRERLKISGKDKLIYVAGPYRNSTEEGKRLNILHAIRVSCRLWELGWFVLCPHCNCANFELFADVPDERYLEGGLAMLKGCQAVFMLKGWEKSQGSLMEHELAEKLGLQIYYEDSL